MPTRSPKGGSTGPAPAVAAAPLGAHAEELGRVEEIGDGIAMVSGLPNVRLDELLSFGDGRFGFAQVLEPELIGAVLLDDERASRPARRCVAPATWCARRSVPAAWPLGRSLGRPLDGKGPVEAEAHEPIEKPAPAIIERDLVTQPVQTGILAIDTLFALGRGQRELIIGDRAIGKTAIAVDAIISQKSSDMISIYVAIGQKSQSVRRASMPSSGSGPPSAPSSWLPARRARPACSGSRPSPPSPWRNISVIAASMPSSSSTT